MKKGILIGVAGTVTALVASVGAIYMWVKDDLDNPYSESYPNAG